MKATIKLVCFLMLISIAACANSKNRKCNGKKAIDTPMGKM